MAAVLALVLSAGTVLTSMPAAGAATPQCHGQAVTLKGTAGSDTLQGTAAPDVIWAGGGNDVIHGGGGEDIMCGGGGNDRITGGSATDVLLGGNGRDRLQAQDGFEDKVLGGAGPDTLLAAGDGATLLGAAGADKVAGTGAGQTLDGGDDDDVITGSTQADAVVAGGSGNDTIDTRGGDDGSPAQPVLGGPGNDLIETGSGSDHAYGESGNDTIDLGTGHGGGAWGGDGADSMSTAQIGSGLMGLLGDDRLEVAAEAVRLWGDEGNDVLIGSHYAEGVVQGGDGDDRINLRGGDDQAVNGDDGADTLLGGSGNDRLYGGAGNDTLETGAGTDDVLRGAGDEDVLRLQSEGSTGYGGDGDDVVTSVVASTHLSGDAGNDTLTGGSGADVLEGGADHDTLIGRDGGDTAHGHDGDDVMDMGDGTDTCTGGTGTDTCDGGTPGIAENTPEDVDTCEKDIETKTSCYKIGLPDVFVGSAYGTYISEDTDSRLDGSWNMQVRLVKELHTSAEARYSVEYASATFEYAGHTDGCTFNESGTLGTDQLTATLQIALDATDSFELVLEPSSPAPTTTMHCPDGDVEVPAEELFFRAHVEGRPWDEAWQASAPDFAGTASLAPAEGTSHQWGWNLRAWSSQ